MISPSNFPFYRMQQLSFFYKIFYQLNSSRFAEPMDVSKLCKNDKVTSLMQLHLPPKLTVLPSTLEKIDELWKICICCQDPTTVNNSFKLVVALYTNVIYFRNNNLQCPQPSAAIDEFFTRILNERLEPLLPLVLCLLEHSGSRTPRHTPYICKNILKLCFVPQLAPSFKLKVEDTLTLCELKKEIHAKCALYCDLRVGSRVISDEYNQEVLRKLFTSQDKILLERKQDTEVKQAQFFENGQLNPRLK